MSSGGPRLRPAVDHVEGDVNLPNRMFVKKQRRPIYLGNEVIDFASTLDRSSSRQSW